MPLTQLLLDRLGWRGSLEALAVLNLGLSLPLHLLVIDSRHDPKTGTPATAAEDRSVVRWAMRQPAFWGLAVAFTIYYGVFSGISFHLYPLLTERGLSAFDVVGAIAVIGPAQVAGRIAIAMVTRKAPIRGIALVTAAALPLAFALLLVAGHSVPALIGFALLYGAANGIMTIVRGAAVPEMLTRSAYGAINGLLTVPTALVRALAPTLAALPWQAGGSYQPVIIVAIAASLVVLGSVWLAARARPR